MKHGHLIALYVLKTLQTAEPLQCPSTQSSTTNVSTATSIIYAIGAGITAGAGTRLFLQLISWLGLEANHSDHLNVSSNVIISVYYLPVSGIGNLRACCLP